MAAYHHAASIGARSMCAARLACLVWAIVCGVLVSPSMGDEQRRRIYFLESLAPTQPAAIRTIEAFQQRLGERTAESFEILIDYMELERSVSRREIRRGAARSPDSPRPRRDPVHAPVPRRHRAGRADHHGQHTGAGGR
jgi:hypothetical protein